MYLKSIVLGLLGLIYMAVALYPMFAVCVLTPCWVSVRIRRNIMLWMLLMTLLFLIITVPIAIYWK